MNYRETILNSKKYRGYEQLTPGQVRYMLPNSARGDFDLQLARKVLYNLGSEGVLERLSSDTYVRPSQFLRFKRQAWRQHQNCEEVTACWHAHRR